MKILRDGTPSCRRGRMVEPARRFARQIGFIKARFSPEGYLGLHLTVGLFVVLLAGWWFGQIVDDVSRDAATRVLDERVIAWFQDRASPGLTQFAWIVTALGSVVFITAGSIVTAFALLKRGFIYRFVAVVVTMGGGSLLNILLKHYFQRQRPVLENPLVTLSSFGFPSGHTMGATLFYGLLGLLIAHSSRWAWSHRIFRILQRGSSHRACGSLAHLPRSSLSYGCPGRDRAWSCLAGLLLDRH